MYVRYFQWIYYLYTLKMYETYVVYTYKHAHTHVYTIPGGV